MLRSGIVENHVELTALTWLKGILIEGHRLLEHEKIIKEVTPSSIESVNDLHDKRMVFEYTFTMVVSQAMASLREVKKLKEVKNSKKNAIEVFLSNVNLGDIRDMREHYWEYFKQEGKKQNSFVRQVRKGIFMDASSTIVDGDRYLIGGHLDVRKTIDQSEKLLLKMSER